MKRTSLGRYAHRQATKADLERQLANANDALEMALAVSPEIDNNFFTGGLSGNYTDRTSWDRKKVFAESLRAWRVNPIARRIVRLARSFIIGKGIKIKCDDENTQKFLDAWSKDPLNKLNKNFGRWKDEDTRTGNLFFLFTISPDGMTYVRAVPAERIENIISAENDIEQETRFTKDLIGADYYEAYDPRVEQKTFMVHFASNRPVGSVWGEGDLAPLLVWIGRYSTWLEDRVRLNHFRNAFMYIVRGKYKNESERFTREKHLNVNQPKPGSVLVVNENNEDWGILSATLDSFDASLDGIAIKKNILSGLGYPMHWFAEPEGSNKTTAEAAGTPTFRTLEEEQDDFFEMVVELARVAVEVRQRAGDRSVKADATIWVDGPDITERDNATLALALGRAYPPLADLFDRDAISPDEFMRQVYKTFAGVWTGKTPNIKKKPLVKPLANPPVNSPVKPPHDPGTDPQDPQEQDP